MKYIFVLESVTNSGVFNVTIRTVEALKMSGVESDIYIDSEKTKPQIPIFKLVNNKKVSPTISLLRLLIIKRMANIPIENNPKMV